MQPTKYVMQTVTIPKKEYESLKKKAELADDVLLQLESSLKDVEKGKIKEAVHD